MLPGPACSLSLDELKSVIESVTTSAHCNTMPASRGTVENIGHLHERMDLADSPPAWGCRRSFVVCGSSTGSGASAPPHAAACSCFARALALDQPGVSPSVGPLRRARLLPTSRSTALLASQKAFLSTIAASMIVSHHLSASQQLVRTTSRRLQATCAAGGQVNHQRSHAREPCMVYPWSRTGRAACG